ncbi:MAG: hypothetical protein KKF48_02490 [Nanoarchaeota archaeon]|nr:hypothetical protein [Nanoarchaeota archaeon]MBU1027889.1 hypothetical protein [Nanoarchaeota archaeon]
MIKRGIILILFVGLLVSVSCVSVAPIIADHNAVMQVDQIPPYWLEKAKELVGQHADRSHGSQVIEGMYYLETHGYPNHSVVVEIEDGFEPPSIPLEEDPPALRIMDGTYPDLDGSLYYTRAYEYWDDVQEVIRDI